MGVSVATEWIENKADGDYEKQDCEQKAFQKLATKLKKMFPRLLLVILADGLCPNRTIFKICRDNGWNFIFTIKEGNLPTIHKQLELPPSSFSNSRERTLAKKGIFKNQIYTWVNGVNYLDFSLLVIFL